MARTAKFLWLVTVCALITLQGCGHQSAGFVGTWKTSDSPGSESTMTFNADQTMSFSASNGPKQAPYKLTGMGTWKATEKDLTVVPAAMQLDMQDRVAKMRLTPYIEKQVNVPQSGPVVWKGEDEFVCTKNGVAQHFRRMK